MVKQCFDDGTTDKLEIILSLLAKSVNLADGFSAPNRYMYMYNKHYVGEMVRDIFSLTSDAIRNVDMVELYTKSMKKQSKLRPPCVPTLEETHRALVIVEAERAREKGDATVEVMKRTMSEAGKLLRSMPAITGAFFVDYLLLAPNKLHGIQMSQIVQAIANGYSCHRLRSDLPDQNTIDWVLYNILANQSQDLSLHFTLDALGKN